MSSRERLLWLRLIRSRRVGPATFWRLLDEEGSAEAALAALPRIAEAAGAQGYVPCPEGVALAELRHGERAGARAIALPEPDYPAPLRAIPDAPPVIWVRGRTDLMARPMLALIGARNASSLGLRMARRLAREAGEAGWIVVSGLARGIDAAAHEAALETGTIAVLAGGVDTIYPPQNADLCARIARGGLLLSDQPMGTMPQARHFPARNRLVSGLSRGVVVIEAAARSGSLITARCALDQGREVLAVPGHPFDARAAGGNLLIRDGAVLVRGIDDITEALGRPAEGSAASRAPVERASLAAARGPASAPAPAVPIETSALHRLILERLGPSPMAEDQLIRDLAQPPGRIVPILTDLEMENLIARQPGGLLTRTS